MPILTTRRDLLAGGIAMTAAVQGVTATREKKFRIAVTGDYEGLATQAHWHTLGSDVEVVFFNKPFESEQATVNALQGFDALALMRERTPLPRAVLEHLPRLKLIVFTGPSNRTLDHAVAAERNIIVCSAATAGAPPAPAAATLGGGSTPAELALALMMACAWNLPAATATIRSGDWAFQPGIPLRGKTLGILGYGHLGQPVARYGIALGMKILAFDRALTDEKAQADGIAKADLEALLRQSDVVSIHLPLTESTRGMIGAKEISLMKPGVFLINTARAAIVEEAPMLEALRTRRIGMAGFDVFHEEPLSRNHPLLKLPNVVMTPHIGFATAQGLVGMYTAEVEILAAYRRGEVQGRYVPAAPTG